MRDNWGEISQVLDLIRPLPNEVQRELEAGNREGYEERISRPETRENLRSRERKMNSDKAQTDGLGDVVQLEGRKVDPLPLETVQEQNFEEARPLPDEAPDSPMWRDEELRHSFIPNHDQTVDAFMLTELLADTEENAEKTVENVLNILASPGKNDHRTLRATIRLYLRGLDWVEENCLGFFTHHAAEGIAIDLNRCLLWAERGFPKVDVHSFHALLLLVYYHEYFHFRVYDAFPSDSKYEKYRTSLHFCEANGDCFERSNDFSEVINGLKLTRKLSPNSFICTASKGQDFYGYPLEEALANAYAFVQIERAGIKPAVLSQLASMSMRQPIGYSDWQEFRVQGPGWSQGLVDLHRLGLAASQNFEDFPYPPPNLFHDPIVRQSRGCEFPNQRSIERSGVFGMIELQKAGRFFSLDEFRSGPSICFINRDAALKTVSTLRREASKPELAEFIRNLKSLFGDLS